MIMALSRVAREFAAEIRLQDWSDAPYRADRAGHNREHDSNRGDRVLSQGETDTVRMNVMWVVGQVLGYSDPNFDVYEFAEACGVDIYTRRGRRDGGIAAGLRRTSGKYHRPGTYVVDFSESGSPELWFGIRLGDRRSRCWRVRSGAHRPELFIEREGLEDFAYLSLHESGQWHMKVRGEGKAVQWLRPDEVTPGFTRAVCIVQPLSVVMEGPLLAHPEAVLLPLPTGAAPTHFEVFIEGPDRDMASWPGQNAAQTVFVGRIPLAGDSGTCCVVARQAPIEEGSVTMPQPSPEQVAQMRASIACGQLYGTLVAQQSDGTFALIDGRFEASTPERMIDGTPDSYLRVLQDVTVHVNGLGKNEIRQISPWAANAISMFGHARQLLIASMVLLERGLPGPAFVLQRPLFEDSLRLAELSTGSEVERIALIANWRRIGLKKVDGLRRKAARDGAVNDAAALKTHVADELNKIDTAIKRRGVAAKDFMKVENAAVMFGREDDYPAYEMSHQAVHGNDLVHLISRETDNEGVLIIGKPRRQYVDAIAEWAARSGLHLARSFHMLTGTIADDSVLTGLEARLTALNEVNDNEPGEMPT
jgi:hypothetical protein